jgi:hypothetical protein
MAKYTRGLLHADAQAERTERSHAVAMRALAASRFAIAVPFD